MLQRSMKILSTLFILASPWVLYITLSQDRVDVAALVLIGWVIVRTLPTLVTSRREDLAAALRLPAIALVFAVLGWIFDSGWMLLILPSATQAAFGLTFLRSLAGTPLVERFARMVKPSLSAAELEHCRFWTRAWGVYLLVLAGIGLVFARFAPLHAWTLYTGVVSYALIGALFAVEYVIRKLRFRDYGRNPIDWLLRALFHGTAR
jgi:uncharacterized membrane protein